MSEVVEKNKEISKKPHRFKKGESGNPNGRPLGVPNKATKFQQELYAALEMFKKNNNKSFLEHFVQRAGKSDTVAIALSKKIVPDKIEQDNIGETKIVIVRANEVK